LLYPERRKEIARRFNICTLQEETERNGMRGRKRTNSAVASKAGFLKEGEKLTTIQKRQIRTDASTSSSNVKHVVNYGFVCVWLQIVLW
jgi:hypothetical protein